MRQMVASLCLLSGCSLLYNPNDLPESKDGSVDSARADANPADLTATDLEPAMLYEGQGVGGSRPAVLTIRGSNFIAGATVTIAPMSGSGTLGITTGTVVVAGDGNVLAVPVSAALQPTNGADTVVPLVITITEKGGTTTIPWNVKLLDKLTTALTEAPPAGKLYSEVNVTAATTIVPLAGAGPVIIHSMSSIILGDITASAAGTVPGSGGCAGGAAATTGVMGSCTGGGGSGSAGLGGTDGGGAGFATVGTAGAAGTAGAIEGDAFLASFAANLPSGGGGGGAGIGGAGGGGGGGGGILELHAEGALTVGAIHDVGGAGSAAGATGGGGAGGAVLLRSGTMLTSGAITLTGGAGGGAGSIGRARYDAPSGSVTGAQMGPSFAPGTPQIVTASPVSISVQVPSGPSFALTRKDRTGTVSTPIPVSGDSTAVASLDLSNGWNLVCLAVPNGNYADDEAKECIEIAFVTK